MEGLPQLQRLRLPPQPIPEDLQARIKSLIVAIESRRSRTKLALRKLVPTRSAIYVEGFDSSVPDANSFTTYVDTVFRDALTKDLDNAVLLLEAKIAQLKTFYDASEALYAGLAERVEEHLQWERSWASGANVENFASEHRRAFPMDVRLDSEASLRASRSGRSAVSEFTRAILRTPLPGARSSPEDKLDGYEKARTALAAEIRETLPTHGGADSSDSVKISSKRFLELARTFAHVDDKLKEYTIADDVLVLPMNTVFDPYGESEALLRLSSARESNVLDRSLAQLESFAQRYKRLHDMTERHRLLAELIRRGRVALEKKAKAKDAAHALDESPDSDGAFRQAFESAERDYEDYVDRVLHPFSEMVATHPLTAREPTIDAFRDGRRPPSSNLREDDLSVHMRWYGRLEGELRALGEKVVCAMNSQQSMRIYAHMMVRMLTYMTLAASRSVRSELATPALIDEMVQSFVDSEVIRETNVLGDAAAIELYKQKATLWGNARWQDEAYPTYTPEPAGANDTAIIHIAPTSVQATFQAGLARSRAALARRRALSARLARAA